MLARLLWTPLPQGVPAGQQPCLLFYPWLHLPEQPQKGLGLLPPWVFATSKMLFSTSNPEENRMLVIRKQLAFLLSRGKKMET